jgi:hypothetical protein
MFLFCVDAEVNDIFNVDFNSIFGLSEAPFSKDCYAVCHAVSGSRGISRFNSLTLLARLASFPSKLQTRAVFNFIP